MGTRLERLRERTNGYTVTPAQYVKLSYIALGALTLIVLTGAAVRLTGSGLGCPTWPKCYGNVYPPLNSHAIIEFSNRLLTGPVCIAAGLAWLGALRRRPYRRDLTRIAALLPLGVIGQAVLGGFTVRGALDYGWVMGHFALSMLILVAAVILVWRATHEPVDEQALVREGEDRTLVRAVRGLVALGALTIFAGTAATAAGPHGGGSPGQKINRLSFDGRATMDFVIHRHAEIAFVFSLAAVALWWLARRRKAAPTVRRPLTILCVLLAVQGLVGLDQYYTHLPVGLVWVHVALASCTWLSLMWVGCASGALLPRRASEALEARLKAPLRPAEPARFPGN
jgi:cytochrome c oxidase assembly protein subunit 15